MLDVERQTIAMLLPLLLLLLAQPSLPAVPAVPTDRTDRTNRCSARNATQATQCPHIHVTGFPRWYEQLNGVYSRSPRGCGGSFAWIQATPFSNHVTPSRNVIHTLKTLLLFGGSASTTTVFAPAPLRCDADPFGAVAVAEGSHVTPPALNNTVFGLRSVRTASNTKARVRVECRCHAALKLY